MLQHCSSKFIYKCKRNNLATITISGNWVCYKGNSLRRRLFGVVADHYGFFFLRIRSTMVRDGERVGKEKLDKCMYGWMYGWMDACMDEWMNG
jgi:hypothetical protein